MMSPGLDVATPTPSVASTATLPVAAAPTATAAPTAAPTLQPTPAPVASIAFVGQVSAAAPGSIAALALVGAEAVALEQGAPLEIVDVDALGATQEAAIRMAVDGGPLLVIVAGSDLAAAARAVAGEYPQVPFIGVDHPAVDSLANYVVIGDPGNRLDEEGFMAGLLAGLVTRQRKVGLLVPAESREGRLYRNGFIHGARYTCGECEFWPFEVADTAETEAGQRAARQFKTLNVDVAFMPAGPAGQAGLAAATAEQIWVIGLGLDLNAASGDPLVLASVVRRPDVALPALARAVLAGEAPASVPFSLANGTLSYSATLSPEVSPGMLGVAGEALSMLAAGTLDTGVDLATGEEK